MEAVRFLNSGDVGRFWMILLFFSIWAIAIALNEVLFSAQPFSLSSIMSSLPHTLIFSSLLSAAVYLAKTKILDALRKGKPIDKKFVAEITPEVGHELNKMRQKIADLDESQSNGAWREGLHQDYDGAKGEFKGSEYAQAQELFAKLSEAASQGQLDPNDPEFKHLLEKAKEQGLNIEDIVAIAADQSIPVFPGLNVPESNTEQANAESQSSDKKETPVQAEQSEVDPEQLAKSKQNIDNLLAKYRKPTEEKAAEEDPIATLERLAAAPDLTTEGLTPSQDSSTPLKLEENKIQPIRPINIQAREQMRAKAQNRNQQRRNSHIEALAQIASEEDNLIEKFRAAAVQGNQLAKSKGLQAQTMQNSSAVQSTFNQPNSGANNVATSLNNVANTAQKAPQNATPKAYPNAAMNNTQPAVARGNTSDKEGVDIYKPRFKRIEEQEKNTKAGLFDGFSGTSSLANAESELYDDYEPQDQVINVPDLPEPAPSSSGQSFISNSKLPPKVRRKDPDAPSLVDTSSLKKYQYVPPKKGAGLDTSALKRVTLPNYNRHDGPSRLGTTSSLGSFGVGKMKLAGTFKPKPSSVSTSSLSHTERRELMEKLKRKRQQVNQDFSSEGTVQNGTRLQNREQFFVSSLSQTSNNSQSSQKFQSVQSHVKNQMTASSQMNARSQVNSLAQSNALSQANSMGQSQTNSLSQVNSVRQGTRGLSQSNTERNDKNSITDKGIKSSKDSSDRKQ